VTVGASNIALLDLGLDSRPRGPAMRKQADAFDLRQTVLIVEL
jgi:hypothetical protein